MGPLPAGPAEPPLVQMIWWLARPISFMERNRKRHGAAFTVRLAGSERPTVFLSDPEAIRVLYTEPAHGLPPGRTIALRPVLGAQSVLLLQGADHLARRRLMLPAFHGERMRSYEAIVREVAERELRSWPQRRAFAVHPSMQAITLEVILRAVVGVSDERRRAMLGERLPRLLGQSSSIITQLRVMLARRSSRSDPMVALQQLMGEIDELLFAEIAERRADTAPAERQDILSLLMEARFADGAQMSDGDLRDQLLTLLLAGHETTATALAWTLEQLLRNPASLAALRAEVDAGAGDEYLRAVIAESLRLRPVVPLAGRRLAAPLDVGGLSLPAGTDVTPAIWLAHTNPAVYQDPYAFRPERFLEGAPPGYGWIPFGGGTRRCLGAAFAEFEMRIVLQTVLSLCDLRAASGSAERVARRNVTFSPRNGTRVRVCRRSGAPAARQPLAA